MKRITIIAMAALMMMAASCKKDKKTEVENAGSGFRATVEGQAGNGKTHLDGLAVKWNENDAILVKSSTCTEPKRFTTTGTDASAYFEAAQDLPADFYAPDYTAYYPADAFSGEQLTLPATQTYVANTFASGANPMVATSSETLLPFKNICGVLDLQLYNTKGCTVKQIELTTNGTENLYGTGMVSFSGELPSLSALSGGNKTLMLDCGITGVALSTSESSPTHFYFVVPANSLGSGFSVRMTDMGGNVWTKTAPANEQNVMERSVIKRMPVQRVVIIPAVTTTAGCVDCTYSVSGNVAVNGNCEYGFVYAETSVNPNPTIGATGCVKYEVNTEVISGSKDFTADFASIGLAEDVQYSIRPYAIYDETGYGDVDVFVYTTPKPLASSWTDNRSPYDFSVGDGNRVYFSRGNLKYVKSTNNWQFTLRQFDIVEKMNQNVGDNYASQDEVSLFGWGTSGYNHGAVCYQPWSTSQSYGDYYAYGSWDNHLCSSNGMADWGKANEASLGSGWRTLTGGINGEWNFLIKTRSNADQLYGHGRVGNCTEGLIILPDDWQWSGEVAAFGPDAPEVSKRWKPGASEWSNHYTYSEWAKMEAAGALFLPAAGWRDGTVVYGIRSYGCYWASTRNYDEQTQYFDIATNYIISDGSYYRQDGFSVRLVRNAN